MMRFFNFVAKGYYIFLFAFYTLFVFVPQMRIGVVASILSFVAFLTIKPSKNSTTTTTSTRSTTATNTRSTNSRTSTTNKTTNNTSTKPTTKCNSAKNLRLCLETGRDQYATQNRTISQSPGIKFKWIMVEYCPNGDSKPGNVCSSSVPDGSYVSACDVVTVTVVKA